MAETAYVKSGGGEQAAVNDGKDGGRIAVLLATDLFYVGVFFFLFTEIGCAYPMWGVAFDPASHPYSGSLRGMWGELVGGAGALSAALVNAN
jgi:hypothetical protein